MFVRNPPVAHPLYLSITAHQDPPDMNVPPDTRDNTIHDIHIRLSLHHDQVGQDATTPSGSRTMTAQRPARRGTRSLALMALALVLASQGLAGCKRHNETVGEKVDHFGDKVQDKLDPPKGPAEKAGRSIDRTLNND